MKQIRYGDGYTFHNTLFQSVNEPIWSLTRTTRRSMTTDDGTQTKTQDKERVVAAISALKAQGADINPYTVSGEAQVPRSTLYRDPELMDLIYRERNGEELNQMSSDEFQTKLAELEEANEALNEQIWELEKQLESMTKAKQDAYVQGFQAGIEEAAKRLSASSSGETTGPRPALQFEPEPEISNPAQHTPVSSPAAHSKQEQSAVTQFEPSPVVAGLGETGYQYAQTPTVQPPHSSNIEETTGDYEALSDSHIAGDFHFDDSLTGQESYDSYSIEKNSAGQPSVVASAASTAKPVQSSNTEETGEHDIFDDIESLVSEQRESEPQPPEPTAPKKRSFPDIDFGLSSESDSNGGEHHEDAVAAGAVTTATRPPEPQPAAVAAQVEEGLVGQLTRDPDGIYNIARSGPTVSSSAYNPLVELSWKDLQTVYNFSVASLKDYAKPGFGNEPGALGGTNFADSSTQQPKAAPAPKQAAKQAERFPEPPDMGQDPRRTGDRLQALSDPRNLLDSEHVVDLDALDIFDDLDDYVDLDKIEVIDDVVAKPKAEEPSMGGDELRELIKGRIKQASEMPNEPSAPRMTTPPSTKEDGKDAKGAAPTGGARNKFIGGAKAGQEPPAAGPSFVVKQIPPEIRKSFMILGLKPEEATQKSVIEAWKKQIASPGVHPDLGGDTEAAVYLNTAKDLVVRWLDQQAPKLGKKFGQSQKPEPPRPPKKDDD